MTYFVNESGDQEDFIDKRGGAASVSQATFAFGPIYDDGTYQYFGEAVPGSATTASVWRVSRMHKTTKQIMWAGGDSNFDNVFSPEGTVTGFTYS